MTRTMPHTTCTERNTLITYAYGECSDEEQTRFEAHLTHCVICATELESIALLQGAIDHMEPDRA